MGDDYAPIDTMTYDEKDNDKENIRLWMAQLIARATPVWLTIPSTPIYKRDLKLQANFWWSIMFSRIYPTKSGNTLTPGRVVVDITKMREETTLIAHWPLNFTLTVNIERDTEGVYTKVPLRAATHRTDMLPPINASNISVESTPQGASPSATIPCPTPVLPHNTKIISSAPKQNGTKVGVLELQDRGLPVKVTKVKQLAADI
ncbi:hypothetical protein HAX54_000979 [Datura stramonium]|uniref:Uncharacterized protein n=1 Tax=Datura stramonium TaxID=4076 RepID=A0ABS8WU69_DATST|nr:hypothetical protein [Datura stramonium]